MHYIHVFSTKTKPEIHDVHSLRDEQVKHSGLSELHYLHEPFTKYESFLQVLHFISLSHIKQRPVPLIHFVMQSLFTHSDVEIHSLYELQFIIVSTRHKPLLVLLIPIPG